MSNRQISPSDPGKEALARARTARALLREQEEQKEKQQQEKQRLRRAFVRNTLCRTALVYTVLNVLYFLIYLAVIYPTKEQPFSDLILGGTSIAGHAVFFAASLLSAAVYSLILYRKEKNSTSVFGTYLGNSCIWFTVVMALCIAAHGIYLDMLYNQYAVTDSAIFLGPSFLLTFAVLLFSLGLTAVNRMYHIQRIPTVARVILHLICVCALISVCIQTIAHGFATNADLLVFLVIFAVLYVFVCIFVFAAKGSIKREENDAEEYESMFKKTPGKASADHPADKTE